MVSIHYKKDISGFLIIEKGSSVRVHNPVKYIPSTLADLLSRFGEGLDTVLGVAVVALITDTWRLGVRS
jgi:hypothetical protein